MVRGAVNERQPPENQQDSITCLGAITNVSRSQSRSSNSAGSGNEENAHIENIDAVTLTEKLETLETDISGDVIRFRARRRGINGAASEKARGDEVESVRAHGE